MVARPGGTPPHSGIALAGDVDDDDGWTSGAGDGECEFGCVSVIGSPGPD